MSVTKDDPLEPGEVRTTRPIEDVKLEDLPKTYQKTVTALKERLPGEVLSKIFELNLPPGEERDVYYVKSTTDLQYLPSDKKPNDPDFMRIGTIGHYDLSMTDHLIVHKAEGQPDVYEIDDGEGSGFDKKDREVFKGLGYNIKRSFIESSMCNQADLLLWLANRSIAEDWYKGMINVMIQTIAEELGIKKKVG